MKRIFCYFILIISLFIIAGCSFNKDDDENKKVEEREVSTEEKNEILDIIEKMKYLDYFGKSFEVKDLTNQEALRASYSIYSAIYPNGELKFSKIAEIADKYLGFSLEPEHLLCDTHFNVLGGSDYIMLYDSDKEEFVDNDNHLGHGGGGFTADVYNRYIDGTVKDDVYIIRFYKLFSDLSTDVREEVSYYYATYNNAASLKDKLFKTTYDYDTNSFDKNPQDELNKMDDDKLVLYTYTFILEDGNYVLDEYKIG